MHSHTLVDDTKLQNKDIAVVEMNEDLCTVCNWCFRNYLLLNPNKIQTYGVWHQQNATQASRYHLIFIGEGLIS